jgi:hypothetical protein
MILKKPIAILKANEQRLSAKIVKPKKHASKRKTAKKPVKKGK